MTDPFDVETPRQRAVVLAALLGYGVLFVSELTTGNHLAGAAADLLLAGFVIPASIVVIRRATNTAPADEMAIVTALAFFVAGVTIGYEGLATLELVTRQPALELVGTFALLLGLVMYLIHSR